LTRAISGVSTFRPTHPFKILDILDEAVDLAVGEFFCAADVAVSTVDSI